MWKVKNLVTTVESQDTTTKTVQKESITQWAGKKILCRICRRGLRVHGPGTKTRSQNQQRLAPRHLLEWQQQQQHELQRWQCWKWHHSCYKHNTNVSNNNNIVSRDVDDTEDYEPTDPENFKEKITKIASWTHEDLAHNTVLGVQTFMTYWNLHSNGWYCFNCNQQLVSTCTDTWEWECPTCKFLEASQGNNDAHWDFGVCGCCNNIGPADMTCVTCLVNHGNKNTYAALTHIMKMYRDSSHGTGVRHYDCKMSQT
jgi:hypothetical protein